MSSSAFLFSEDLDVSCQKLARLSTLFIENLVSMSRHFPVSLRWLLGNLKTMVKQKWPHINSRDLRRPISDAIFSSILSLAIVNPDSYGVIDPSLIISEVGRYNLTQVMTVLQGCVWIMGKPANNKYPVQKVVRRMDVVSCVSREGGRGPPFPPHLHLPPSLHHPPPSLHPPFPPSPLREGGRKGRREGGAGFRGRMACH
jgi:hypothetical protein